MEKFDILDVSGRPTGLIANKGTLLNEDQYYLGVHAYIYNTRNEFLLQQRALNKEFLPGGWDIHMGHVIAGESSAEGIAREIHEEIGLRFDRGDIRFVGRIVWEIYHHMIDIYFLRSDFAISQLSLQKEEVIGAKFVSQAVMLDLVSKMYYRPVEYRALVTEEIAKLR
jgi:isopentenyldiphosphate isomerase